jgi:hypothetical protein
MEPEKRKRLEDEFVIIDEDAELRKEGKQKRIPVERELHVMTRAQQESLRSQAKKAISQWLIGAGIAFLFVIVTAVSSAGGAGSGGLVALVVAGFLAFTLGIAGYIWSKADSDLRGKRVEYREGVISLDVQGGGQGGASYKVSIEGETFMISKELFLSLSNHQPYRIYFAPKSRYILGTEPL